MFWKSNLGHVPFRTSLQTTQTQQQTNCQVHPKPLTS